MSKKQVVIKILHDTARCRAAWNDKKPTFAHPARRAAISATVPNISAGARALSASGVV